MTKSVLYWIKFQDKSHQVSIFACHNFNTKLRYISWYNKSISYRESLNNIDVTFLDIIKAFHTVNHWIRLAKYIKILRLLSYSHPRAVCKNAFLGLLKAFDISYVYYFLPLFTVSCMKPVIFLLCNNLFIYQVLCTLIYRRRSLYSFLLNHLMIQTKYEFYGKSDPWLFATSQQFGDFGGTRSLKTDSSHMFEI